MTLDQSENALLSPSLQLSNKLTEKSKAILFTLMKPESSRRILLVKNRGKKKETGGKFSLFSLRKNRETSLRKYISTETEYHNISEKYVKHIQSEI